MRPIRDIVGGFLEPVAGVGTTALEEHGATRRAEIGATSTVQLKKLENARAINAGVSTARPLALHALRRFALAWGISALLSLVVLSFGGIRGWPGVTRENLGWIVAIWAGFGGGLIWVIGTVWLGYAPFRSMFDKKGLAGIFDKLRPSGREQDVDVELDTRSRGDVRIERRERPDIDVGEQSVHQSPPGSAARLQAERVDIGAGRGVSIERRQREFTPERRRVHPILTTRPAPARRRPPAAPARDISRLYRALRTRLRADEGVRLYTYPDSRGFKTAGIGELITTDDPLYGLPFGTAVTKEWVETRFRESSRQALVDAHGVVPGYLHLPFDAQMVLAEMAYQMGRAGLEGFARRDEHTGEIRQDSTVGRILAGQYREAAAQMRRSLWATQTPSRARRAADRIAALEHAAPPT